ncbi:DNA-directed RNA polymerase beta subunit protein [Minicystis rosea]|nr:DNA-directed RNA polymerase beta subunit protein [Minicystis rosea]
MHVTEGGRSQQAFVIVAPDPTLPLDACALPTAIAIALFAPGDTRDPEDVVASIEHEVTSSILTIAPVPRGRREVIAVRARLGEGNALGLHPARFARFLGRRVRVCRPRDDADRADARRRLRSPELLSPWDGSFLDAPTREATVGLWYATQDVPGVPHAGAFPSTASVAAAFEVGGLAMHAPIDVRIAGRRIRTTVGRALLREALPSAAPLDLAKPLGAAGARRLLEAAHCTWGARAATDVAEALWRFGLRFATQSGLSLGMEDLRVPAEEKAAILDEAKREQQAAERDYQAGTATNGEVYHRTHDAFDEATARMHDALAHWLPAPHPLRMLRDAGAGLDDADILRLVGVLPTARVWEGSERTFDRSLADGLSPHDAFALTLDEAAARVYEPRRGASVLRRRLLTLLGGVRVTRYDCGTGDGAIAFPAVHDMQILASLRKRVTGRVALEDTWNSNESSPIVRAGAIIDERAAERLDRAHVPSVRIRSLLTCKARDGVCALCHGWDRAARRLPAIGARVGLDAADLLASRPRRPRLLFGAAARVYASYATRPSAPLPAPGWVRFEGITCIEVPVAPGEPKSRIMMADQGRVVVHDACGKEIAAYLVRRGHHIECEDGAWLPRGAKPVSTYRYGEPMVAVIPEGATGIASWDATRTQTIDERTGAPEEVLDIHRVHIRGSIAGGAPFEQIVPCEGDGHHVMVYDGDVVERGTLIVLDAHPDPRKACSWLAWDELFASPSEPAPFLGRQHVDARHHPRAFAHHLVVDLEEAILGTLPREGTAAFELVARALLDAAPT